MIGCYLLEACSFIMRDITGVEPQENREEVGGIEGGETIISICSMRKEPVFKKGDGEVGHFLI